MEQVELAVRLVPGELPRQGVVIERGATARAAVLVEWIDGEQERVKSTDRSVGYASKGSQRLQWLLEPGLIQEEFESDPVKVFATLVHETGKITITMIKRRLADLGLHDQDVTDAYAKVKDVLKAHPHVLVTGQSHAWSETPIVRVDPYEHLRKLPPHEALVRLESAKGLKAAEKTALADAVRTALSNSK